MTKQSVVPPRSGDDLSSHTHRQTIGYLGFALPWLVLLMANIRPIRDLPNTGQLLGSVSAYYWTASVIVFEGILAALAVFLFTYQGYDNEDRRRDRITAIVAGFAALLVGVFPTFPPNDVIRADAIWWQPPMAAVHQTSAVILFGSFIFFSLVLFPKTKSDGKPLPREKKVRNAIYRICGGAMTASVLWCLVVMVANKFFGKSWTIFWGEAFALQFFAISWLVKGKADYTAVAGVARAAELVRSPFKPVAD